LAHINHRFWFNGRPGSKGWSAGLCDIMPPGRYFLSCPLFLERGEPFVPSDPVDRLARGRRGLKAGVDANMGLGSAAVLDFARSPASSPMVAGATAAGRANTLRHRAGISPAIGLPTDTLPKVNGPHSGRPD